MGLGDRGMLLHDDGVHAGGDQVTRTLTPAQHVCASRQSQHKKIDSMGSGEEEVAVGWGGCSR